MNPITLEDIQQNETIKTYIVRADETLIALGYTEHAFAHVTKTAYEAYSLLLKLGYDERTAELARIAGYLHDIGNMVNRVDHAQSGALIAFQLLTGLGMPPQEIATIVTAIGHHDEAPAAPVNPVAAALILADKCDVRRSRVRNRDVSSFDIHDRVNYSVVRSEMLFDHEKRTLTLLLEIDTEICAVMDYFEIFLSRMVLCRQAAEHLDITFKLNINGQSLL